MTVQNPIVTRIVSLLAQASDQQLRVIYMVIAEILKKS